MGVLCREPPSSFGCVPRLRDRSFPPGRRPGCAGGPYRLVRQLEAVTAPCPLHLPFCLEGSLGFRKGVRTLHLKFLLSGESHPGELIAENRLEPEGGEVRLPAGGRWPLVATRELG